VSGLAGVYGLDGRLADVSLLKRLIEAVAHRGPDGEGCWTDGPIGLGHRISRTTPESFAEKQPLLDESGALGLVLDGRIDNRAELAASLRAAGVHLRTDTDAELVLQSYGLWVDGCASRIVGDFAFAIWDRRRRRLFCARDPLGIRPFYYRDDGQTFIWGSELRQLLDTLPLGPEPNEGMLGEYLSSRLVDCKETLYRGILRLPPGHVLTVEDGRVHTTRYFDVDPRHEIRYRSDDEYAEHFREIFREAVRCRLRSVTPVAVFLSGGLDSSSIAGVAARLARNGHVPGPGFEAYSLDFTQVEADERNWVDDVARMWELPVRHVRADAAVSPSLAEQVADLRDFPDLPNTHPWGLLLAEARRRGARTALWGYGGDEWLTGDTAHCADLLRRLRLVALTRRIRDDIRSLNLLGGPSVGLADSIRWCVWPLVPRPAKRLVRRFRSRDVPDWIAPDFARRVGLQERLAPDVAPPRLPTFAQRGIHRQLRSGWSVAEYEMVDRYERRRSMESRFPFNDRRLIEFALALPEEQRWRGTETKFILRRAAGDLLPSSVAHRKTKGDFTYLYAAALEREGGDEAFARLHLEADGFVRGDRVREMYRRFRGGDFGCLGALWMILATEWWYRTMFPASGAALAHEEIR
jgi:asparagine synthase (glutamine-hydrolysing)